MSCSLEEDRNGHVRREVLSPTQTRHVKTKPGGFNPSRRVDVPPTAVSPSIGQRNVSESAAQGGQDVRVKVGGGVRPRKRSLCDEVELVVDEPCAAKVVVHAVPHTPAGGVEKVWNYGVHVKKTDVACGGFRRWHRSRYC